MPVFTNIAAYKLTSLGELAALQAELRQFCTEARMRGTILLGPEGINVFVAADRLLVRLRSIPGLEDLTAKVSESDHQPFNRMLVKIKKEIIAFGVSGIVPPAAPRPGSHPANSSNGSTRAAPLPCSTPAISTK